MDIHGFEIPVYAYNTIVVGTGAAGFNAADRLYGYGQPDIAIVTEHVKAGTSRNTGSDKQTYYKLTLSGNVPDSVADLTRVLFAGQCVDGDIALAEAALSVQCFLKLAELGVSFPQNRYGEYIGYKTDHDPGRRATSAGPYTSKMMTECLERTVNEKKIPIYDKMQVIKILVADGKVCGLLALNLRDVASKEGRFAAFICKNIIYATGGPAGIYRDSVYPLGHYGATGLAFEAGVSGKNLTEWQYGLASIKPRWNVSGTYMQVLPKFVSTDASGGDAREFLLDFFANKGEMLSKVFLKGYQWPFDVGKIAGGSSIIDLLVDVERNLKGRRVFLDFRENPGNVQVDFETLTEEAREYLTRAGATFGTPIERLRHMNEPAIAFYRDKGVDLTKEPLEIALCAQHNNGGLGIDAWWHTNVEGFFAAGEVSASHGVYRPGGSALNAGQVGSTRAARYIAARRQGEPPSPTEVVARCQAQITEAIALSEAVLSQEDNLRQVWEETTERMSRCGAAIRDRAEIKKALEEIKRLLAGFNQMIKIGTPKDLPKVFRLYDILICQIVYLGAMIDYIEHGGKSRGSALYSDPRGSLPDERLPETFRFLPDDGSLGDQVQEVAFHKGESIFSWRKVRPIPKDDDFFENVWRSYRESGNIDK